MKDVMGRPSARSPCSSSRSDVVGSGGHWQEVMGSLPPVALASSSVSQRAVTSLSRDNWSSFGMWKSEGPGSGSQGALWAGLLSGKNLGGGGGIWQGQSQGLQTGI